MAIFAAIAGVFSVILCGIAMVINNPVRSKVLMGFAVSCVIPDLYVSGGLHGAIQSIIIMTLFFLGAAQLPRVEKIVKIFLPLFTLFLLFKLQEPEGLLLVLAGIATPLATVMRNNKEIKVLLFISMLCWGVYAYLHGAWFTFAFDVVGISGIIYSLARERKTQ